MLVVAGEVEEGDVLVGPGVKVIKPVHVGDGAMLVAGAVVTKNMSAGEVWEGVPALHFAHEAELSGHR